MFLSSTLLTFDFPVSAFSLSNSDHSVAASASALFFSSSTRRRSASTFFFSSSIRRRSASAFFLSSSALRNASSFARSVAASASTFFFSSSIRRRSASAFFLSSSTLRTASASRNARSCFKRCFSSYSSLVATNSCPPHFKQNLAISLLSAPHATQYFTFSFCGFATLGCSVIYLKTRVANSFASLKQYSYPAKNSSTRRSPAVFLCSEIRYSTLGFLYSIGIFS